MAEYFFQERFLKNLKFYEGKTPKELEKAYESIYGDLELQDIYLAELMLIIKALNNEKEIKTDINFNGFISDINKLYAQIEAMSRKEILENQEQIEMIIAAAKLSLNSPTYFIVDIEQLKTFNLNDELTKFIGSQPTPQNGTTILKDFKEELEAEIKTKTKLIDNLSKNLDEIKEGYQQFQDIYWELVNPDVDPIEHIGALMGIAIIRRETKQKLLNAINEMVQTQAAAEMEDFKRLVINISSGINKRIQDAKNEIFKHQRYASIIKKLSQSIDENGNLIQLINEELIGQCAKQIDYSKLDQTAIQLQLLSEQTRVAKKQITVQNTREIEKRTKALTKRRQSEQKSKEQTDEIRSFSDQYRDWVKTANGIVEEELKQDIMILDEIEKICIEDELQKDDLTPKDIKKTVINTANSDLCRIKFIIYGLKYQLEHLNKQNENKTMELIAVYIKYYNEYKDNLTSKVQEQEAQNGKIDEKIELLIDTRAHYKSVEEMFKGFTKEQTTQLLSLRGVGPEEITEELEQSLKDIGLNSDLITLYDSYMSLKQEVEETLEFLEVVRGEEIKKEDIDIINNNLSTIKDLLAQFETSKEMYEERQIEKQNTKNEDMTMQADNTNDSKSILVFFEIEDGISQAEERILEDSKKFGRYRSGEIGELQRLLERLEKSTPDELRPPLSTKLKNLANDGFVGHRLSTGGVIRIAYDQMPSDVLNTKKPVYLIISAGKKSSNGSNVYDDAMYLENKVEEFKKYYKSLRYATPEEKQRFLDKQKELEQRIMYAAQNGKGAVTNGTSYQ